MTRALGSMGHEVKELGVRYELYPIRRAVKSWKPHVVFNLLEEFRDIALYDQNVDRVYRLAHRMTGDDELARDFTQDAFIRAFEKIDQFRGEAALSTWLRSIAVSVILNGLRKVKRLCN